MFLQPKITAVKPLPGNRILVSFETGEEKRFDVTPYIKGSWFGELADEQYFKRVFAFEDGSGISWPDGQDIAPHELWEQGI